MAKEISLETAIGEIKQACTQSEKNGHCPFFFIVGAGISSPSVPLAKEIIIHCKEKAVELKKKIDELDPQKIPPIDLYSYYFGTAYSQPAHRQEYLRGLIEKKQISAANLRLAHILLSKKITNMVVTPNFDDFLTRSLNLFGLRHIVCDHPKTVERINILNKEIQIVHVHGTYWFYDCCNLRDEIKKMAKGPKGTVFTMASLLDQILVHRSPLVIGYSGWEGDIIMSALKRRLKTGLPYNLYWFCYKREDINFLPRQLKKHPNVYFVLPQQDASEAKTASKDEEGLIQKTEKGFAEKEKKTPELPAVKVFEELIKAIDIPQPDLTRDPLEFMERTLRESFFLEETETDIYYLNKVVEKIEKAKKLLEEKTAETERLLETLRDLMRCSQYRQAINEIAKISMKTMDMEKVYEIFSITWSATTKLLDGSKEELMGYDQLREIGESLIQNRKYKKDVLPKIAKSLFNKGVALYDCGDYQKAIACYDEVIKRFNSSKESIIQEMVASAMVKKGNALGKQGKIKEANDIYTEVIKRFTDHKESTIKKMVAYAFNNLGYYLLLEAKKSWNTKDASKFKAVLLKAQEKINMSLDYNPDSPVVLGNKGYNSFLLGDREEAANLLAKAIALGGEKIREVVLNDTEINRIPQDEEFKALVKSIRAHKAKQQENG